jgi:uncharacterized protein (TIGR00661 family)
MMKIFYAVQATGNGHISRSMELLPHLQQFGEVDIFLSGANSTLDLNGPVKYRSPGLSLFYKCNGSLDYWKMLREYAPLRLRKEINELPVEKYDLIINDFDYITAAACARKQVFSVNFGHQASFLSNKTPRPAKKSAGGEWVLKNYAKASAYVGLHFRRYDDFIFTPVIKKDILDADPSDQGFVSVYLPSYCEPQLIEAFGPLKDCHFEIFSRETNREKRIGNICFLPIDKKRFTKSLIHCSGIITGGGFETPAEALQLGKKLMVLPIRGQYEQLCNTAALERMGIPRLEKLDEHFRIHFETWMNQPDPCREDYSASIDDSLHYLFSLDRSMTPDEDRLPRELSREESWKI